MMAFANLEASFTALVVFVFGLLIGSFLNVVIHRLPADESIVWPGSRCPHCTHALAAWENIPLLSWLLLRARCSACRAPISWRYPATELATACLFLGAYMAHGLTWQLGFLCVLLSLLVVTFWIDLDHMLILDAVTVPGIVLGLVYSALTGQFWYALAAALYGVAILMLLNHVTLLAIGRDGVGEGDLWLAAMLGAWLGLSGALLALGLAVLAGAGMGLALLFARWLAARSWQPFAIAAGVTAALYGGLAAFMGTMLGTTGGLGLILGTELAPNLRAATLAISALLGASSGWLYMRLKSEAGFLDMPFGPALVLGAIGSLFFGVPLVDWYTSHLGAF